MKRGKKGHQKKAYQQQQGSENVELNTYRATAVQDPETRMKFATLMLAQQETNDGHSIGAYVSANQMIKNGDTVNTLINGIVKIEQDDPESVQRQITKLSAEVTKLSVDLATSQQRYVILGTLLNKIRADNDTIRADNDIIRADNDTIRADNDIIRADNDTIRAENSKLRDKVNELDDKFNRLKSALAAIVHSL